MSMDIASAILIIKLVSEGIGAAQSVIALAKRVEAGEKITEDEINAARAEIDNAVTDWNDSVAESREEENGSD